jgi:hypothetical protein
MGAWRDNLSDPLEDMAHEFGRAGEALPTLRPEAG